MNIHAFKEINNYGKNVPLINPRNQFPQEKVFHSSTLVYKGVSFSHLPLNTHNLTLLFISRAKSFQNMQTQQGLYLVNCD